MLGQKLKSLREAKGLLQRQVAAALEVDTAYISKMESSDKPVSKSYLPKLSKLYGVSVSELQTLWLANKVYEIVKDNNLGIKAVEMVQKLLENKK